MLIARQLPDLPPSPRGTCVALGMFDGVHLGHQHVLRAALLDAAHFGARAVALTFDPHPLAVVNPERAPRLLQTAPQRLRAIAALGCWATVVVPFTAEFATRSGEDFVRELARAIGPLRSVSVGEGFNFGHRRSGNVPLLQRLGAELGFATHAASPVSIGGDTVSSSRIREALRAGRLPEVAELLGRPYALAGIVQTGERLARRLGFPTANVAVDGLELPPSGVYAAHVRQVAGGQEHAAVLNLGLRPTVTPGETRPRLEVHLLDFSGDLYGQEIEVEFACPLRPEQKFAGLEALQRQIAEDVAAARRFHGT